MGGSGSGRWGGRTTVDRSLTLSLPDLFRQEIFKRNESKAGTILFRDHYDGEVIGSVRYQANLGSEGGRIHVEHGGSCYWLRLTSTPQPFGGCRWWFECPITEERVLKLHKPGGARMYASRKAYRLGYTSQRQSPRDRALTQSFKISDRYENDDGELVKPKWMRWATFDREMAKMDRYGGTADAALAETAAKLIGAIWADRK